MVWLIVSLKLRERNQIVNKHPFNLQYVVSVETVTYRMCSNVVIATIVLEVYFRFKNFTLQCVLRHQLCTLKTKKINDPEVPPILKENFIIFQCYISDFLKVLNGCFSLFLQKFWFLTYDDVNRFMSSAEHVHNDMADAGRLLTRT